MIIDSFKIWSISSWEYTCMHTVIATSVQPQSWLKKLIWKLHLFSISYCIHVDVTTNTITWKCLRAVVLNYNFNCFIPNLRTWQPPCPYYNYIKPVCMETQSLNNHESILIQLTGSFVQRAVWWILPKAFAVVIWSRIGISLLL